MVAWSRSSVLAFSAVTGILAWLAACEPYEPDAGAGGFQLPGPHVNVACEDCHGPPPFVKIPWDDTCVSCHDLDRKDDAAHAAYTTCTGTGCHEVTHMTWTEALLAVDHDFLPLEGPHAIECVGCHNSAVPSLEDVIPPGGNSTSCSSCHEEDRSQHPDGAENHYTDDPTDPKIVPDSERRWDCKPCHDQRTVEGKELSKVWRGPPVYRHKTATREIKVPHGTQAGGPAAPVAVTDPALWVTACEDCHPSAPKDYTEYTCSDECHQNVLEIIFHPATEVEALGDDDSCMNQGCHPHADRRPDYGL